MFQPIEEYMKKSREERQAHLRLDEDCIKIGGYDSREYRGLLAHTLLTEIPTGKKVCLCHACHYHWCSNPRHMYWGTYADNSADAKANGIDYKNGYLTGNTEAAKAGSSKGGKGNARVPKSPEHRKKISESLKRKQP